MTDSLLTTGQVAERLRINRRTVWQRVQHGQLTPAVKLPGANGGYLFDRAEIEAMKEANK